MEHNVIIMVRVLDKFTNVTHSFAKCLLSTGYVPSVGQWAENAKIKKTRYRRKDTCSGVRHESTHLGFILLVSSDHFIYPHTSIKYICIHSFLYIYTCVYM